MTTQSQTRSSLIHEPQIAFYMEKNFQTVEDIHFEGEVAKESLVVYSPKRKAFQGRLMDYCNQTSVRGDLTFVVDDDTFHIESSYQNKIVMFYNINNKQDDQLIRIAHEFISLGAVGFVTIQSQEFEDDVPELEKIDKVKQCDHDHPLLALNRVDSLRFIRWLSLLVLSFPSPMPKTENDLDPHDPRDRHSRFSRQKRHSGNPSHLDHDHDHDHDHNHDHNHEDWKSKKESLKDRRYWYQARFGPMKPDVLTPLYYDFYSGALNGYHIFDEREPLHDYTFLYVSGLYHNMLPGNEPSYADFLASIAQEFDLDIKKVEVDVDRGTLHNSEIIANNIRSVLKANKKVVLIGHSKGTVDISTALTMHPELRGGIRLFTSLMSCFGGCPVASALAKEDKQKCRTVIRKVLNHCLSCSTDGLLAITLEARHKFLTEHPYPVGAVPAVSIVTTRAPLTGLAAVSYRAIKKRYHEENDGIATVIDAQIPGSKVVYLSGVDHRGPTKKTEYYNDTKLFLASILAFSLYVTSDHFEDKRVPDCQEGGCCQVPFDHVMKTSKEKLNFKGPKVIPDPDKLPQ
eukprot:TRINITY_DN17364_c0_g1_i1.p1 TRINITY_DN17364_c0_g1~~TRINITY_DN17364_c0_g1_i1.p1  ORF type:complete len:585 (-),score=115.38 TRINITY_DN17364_c0_g1_i1:97-1809(-)